MSETSALPTRRFQPIPVEQTVKKVRRFAAEPVETSTRSSKNVERKEDNDSTVERKDMVGKRRLLPTPVESSFKSARLHAKGTLPTPEPTPVSIPRSPPSAETPKSRRKFAPQLIETTKRSKRAYDSRPATLPTDKTDLTPGVPNIYTARPKQKAARIPVAPGNSPYLNSIRLNSSHIPPLAPRRQPSMRPHLNTRRSTRQNSFQPELDDIPQDENSNDSEEDGQHSDGESTPSLTASIGSSEDSMMRLQLARTRESCDDRFSGYLLALAAKAAEKQLKEQALAAFPNESLHELVEHFYDREMDTASDEECVEGIGMLIDDHLLPEMRRKSTEVGWAAREMQEHQEKLSRLREEATQVKIAAEAREPTFNDPFWTNGMTTKLNLNNENVDPQKETELRCMRSAASPPMLGTDLKFKMCPSPKATKFETDQKADVHPNRSETGGGLWGGYCVTDDVGEYVCPGTKGPVLIQTPHSEPEDPFSTYFAGQLPGGAKTPRSRDSGVRMLAGIDERLKAEVVKSKAQEALLEEFDDTFVTQVYNYLSLGYPSLARQYDEELARISKIPEEDLRQNDNKKNAKGYIVLADVSCGAGCTPEKKRVNDTNGKGDCARWQALRIYILEWARQHPSMSNGAMGPSAWGVRARRGSWAI